MGIMDNLVGLAKNEIENTKAKALKQAECSKDRSIPLSMSFGFKELGLGPSATLRQKLDGATYFNYDDSEIYKIVDYHWNGPTYDSVMTANTKGSTNSETTKKGKSGKMATGAIIGTVLFPGVGTVVGAAIGAGGKSKAKTQSTNESATQQVHKQVEKDNTAILKLQRISDGTVFPITIACNSKTDSQIQCFKIEKELSISSSSKEISDSLKGIKALKELLDMGAITQEEFDTKKKQLLNQ
ncbi:SHOCT domain-containing protein [Lacrimispora indolis]|uniref:SHOCT domain-containing protein n=1 Tax=Lacrimispora indolis TaxID=69825 RepID=UPI00045E7153|nr:SHOCT domain-containing protein [Lacrimispora indolis]